MILIWLALIVLGNKVLLEYNNKDIESNDHPLTWPNKSSIPFSTEKNNLVIFIHPKCPCSKASLNELNRLLSQYPDFFNSQAVFVKVDTNKEANSDDSLEQRSLWQKAKKISKLNTLVDGGGKEAKLFSVKSSGRVLIYNQDSKLIFAGGLTAARGMEGDNIGKKRIISYIKGTNIEFFTTPSFGCSLY